MEIMRDVGMRPMVVIRFNPDAYGSFTSCFGLCKDGFLRVRPSSRREWAVRLASLLETVEASVRTPPTKELEVIHLFFD